MSLLVVGLVLLAALLHASWNALLRGGQDRLQSMVVMDIVLGLGGLLILPFSGLPSTASLPMVAASGLLHTLYNVLLVRTYRSGDLGEAYPVARGSSPALVAIGAAVVAQERVTGLALLGIALVSGGILSLSMTRRRFNLANLPAALATGATIACYTVVDGLGVRVSGDWFAYTAAMFSLELLLPVAFVAGRGFGALRASRRETVKSAIGGAVSFAAYGVVIWALQLGAMGAVSALRETSVVFATVLGRLFLGETLTAKRLLACGVIALGAVCLA